MNRRRPLGGFSDSDGHAHYRIDANERVCSVRWQTLEFRLLRIEETLERLERRLWLTVYGVVAAVLAQAAVSLAPGLGL